MAINDKAVLSKKQRKTHSEEERKTYYHSWKTSGLSKGQFCKNHQLSEGAFYAWCHRYDDTSEKSVNSFSPVMPTSSAREAVVEILTVEMLLPNQTQLRIAFREDRLIGFLQELCHATATIR